jgi:hypothetical protein
MNEPDALISEYYRLSPTHFVVLRSLSITQGISSHGICEQSLSVIFAKATDVEDAKLYLSFRGVRNLVFQQPEWSQISIGHLEILSGNEVANVCGRYLVRDAEQEQIIWFECNDFDFHVE